MLFYQLRGNSCTYRDSWFTVYTLTAVSLRPARYLGRFSAGAIIIGINFLALLPTNWMYGRESGKEAYCQNDAHSSFIPEISNFNIFEITNSLIRCHNINFVNCALIFPFLVTCIGPQKDRTYTALSTRPANTHPSLSSFLQRALVKPTNAT